MDKKPERDHPRPEKPDPPRAHPEKPPQPPVKRHQERLVFRPMADQQSDIAAVQASIVSVDALLAAVVGAGEGYEDADEYVAGLDAHVQEALGLLSTTLTVLNRVLTRMSGAPT